MMTPERIALSLNNENAWSLPRNDRMMIKQNLFALLCQAMRNEPEDPIARKAMAGFSCAEEATTTDPEALDDLVKALLSSKNPQLSVRNAMLFLVEVSHCII